MQAPADNQDQRDEGVAAWDGGAEKPPDQNTVCRTATARRVKSAFLFSPVTFASNPLNHHIAAAASANSMRYKTIIHEPAESAARLFIFYFFKNALNKSIGSGRNVVVLCSLAISRMVWR